MDRRGELRPALAAMAAVAGTAYASGREVVIFFSQLGWAAWVGIPAAALAFGLLAGFLCDRMATLNARSLAALCARLPGRWGRAARWMCGLFMALVAAAMLAGAGELGALTLPVRHGWLAGVALALSIALLLNASGLRPLPWLGLLTLMACLAFYGALALDGRPVRLHIRGDVTLALEGNVPAALLLALVYGAMNACVAAGALARFGARGVRAWRAGMLCAGFIGAVLACANGAIARGGRLLLGQALPTVALSARWGLAGFWCRAVLGYLCAVSTLSAAAGDLTSTKFDVKY